MKLKNMEAPARITHQGLVRKINDICKAETGTNRNFSRDPGSTPIGNRSLKDVRLEVFAEFMGWTEEGG